MVHFGLQSATPELYGLVTYVTLKSSTYTSQILASDIYLLLTQIKLRQLSFIWFDETILVLNFINVLHFSTSLG